MKKQILGMSVMALLAAGLTFTGCKKSDTNAPTITLKGNSTVDVTLGSTYTDEGATAEDKEDGNLTDKITTTGTVNTKLAGKYVITYTVADAAGNEASETRTVTVKNSAEAYAGYYTAYESVGKTTYQDTVKASATEDGVLVSSRFANYTNAPLAFKITGTVISFKSNPTILENVGKNKDKITFTNVKSTATAANASSVVLSFDYTEATAPANTVLSGTIAMTKNK